MAKKTKAKRKLKAKPARAKRRMIKLAKKIYPPPPPRKRNPELLEEWVKRINAVKAGGSSGRLITQARKELNKGDFRILLKRTARKEWIREPIRVVVRRK
jgi:hypothetical protein